MLLFENQRAPIMTYLLGVVRWFARWRAHVHVLTEFNCCCLMSLLQCNAMHLPPIHPPPSCTGIGLGKGKGGKGAPPGGPGPPGKGPGDEPLDLNQTSSSRLPSPPPPPPAPIASPSPCSCGCARSSSARRPRSARRPPRRRLLDGASGFDRLHS